MSDVTARKHLAEALAAAQERLVHLLSCDIEREPASVAQLAAAGSSLDRHESRHVLLPQRVTNARASIPAETTAQTRIVSKARIRLDTWKTMRTFQMDILPRHF